MSNLFTELQAEAERQRKQIKKPSVSKKKLSGKSRKSAKMKTKTARLHASLQASNIASNIAILQFDDADLGNLRQSADKARTYRFSLREIEWIKDTSHNLSKEIQRGKVSQVDILRVAIKLFENALAVKKKDLLKIFERMK